MNAHVSIISPPNPATLSVTALISAHFESCAVLDRLVEIADERMADATAVENALVESDRLLVAICSARPSSPADLVLRREYLLDVLPPAVEGCADLTKAVLEALIDECKA